MMLREDGADHPINGELNQAIGRSRGGRTTKIHALTDELCRPVAFLLTGGHVADCKAGEALIQRMPSTSLLNADKGYDSDAIRRQVKERGAFANIPPKANRKWKNCFSPYLYRDRNAIERMFCRLKDFRRIATRYDRLATNFLATICIAATVSSSWVRMVAQAEVPQARHQDSRGCRSVQRAGKKLAGGQAGRICAGDSAGPSLHMANEQAGASFRVGSLR
jgi:transposase